jgi:excisionase family DNA binding protein
MDKRGYTYEEAARYLGTSERTVKELAAMGAIPRKYIGNRVVLDVADLDAYFDSLPDERPTS